VSLNPAENKPPAAWQPLTPRGVAAFGRAHLGRLLLVQFVVALLAAAATIWFLHRAWFPAVGEAIDKLPAAGEIRGDRLEWRGPSPQGLAENRWLALSVDLQHEGNARSPADLAVEFGRTDVRIYSLFGFVQVPYEGGGVTPFNQPDLEPWWGAWAPPILAIVAGDVILGLLASWALLATLYCLPVWLLAFFANKDLDLRGCWRLSGAALMPGALFCIAAIVGYGLGMLDLVKLLVAGGVHFVIGWVYLVLGTFAAQRHPEAAAGGNPFNETK
jgi:hypothetical protein